MIEGCDLGAECLDDAELGHTALNFVSLETYPNLLGSDLSDIVNFNTDLSYFKNIIPHTTQAANLFIMKSELMLQDNIYDIFDTEKEEKQIF